MESAYTCLPAMNHQNTNSHMSPHSFILVDHFHHHKTMATTEDILLFLVEDQNLFHQVNIRRHIFISCKAMSENITI